MVAKKSQKFGLNQNNKIFLKLLNASKHVLYIMVNLLLLIYLVVPITTSHKINTKIDSFLSVSGGFNRSKKHSALYIRHVLGHLEAFKVVKKSGIYFCVFPSYIVVPIITSSGNPPPPPIYWNHLKCFQIPQHMFYLHIMLWSTHYNEPVFK